MLNFNGDGRHTEEEIVTILRYDLKALDVILGDKQWFVGGRPTLVSLRRPRRRTPHIVRAAARDPTGTLVTGL